MSQFHSTQSKVIAGFIVGFALLSFLITGYNGSDFGLSSGGGALAKVGSFDISVNDYQNELNRQMAFYKQIMGGQDLTSQQIEQFRLKEQALESVIEQKLMLILADKMNMKVAPLEITDKIKELPYFQTNKQFDINLYKTLLTQNGYTPADFEKLIANDLKNQKVTDLWRKIPVSENLAKEIAEIKENKFLVSGVRVSERDLLSFVEISDEQVKQYVNDEKNKGKIQTTFNSEVSELDTPERVKASHILVATTKKKEEDVNKILETIKKELTPKNFKEMAKKYTDDPSGKTNGGDLGWFTHGRMVPEFDEAAFKANKGQIVGPIKTNFGFHFIMVEDKEEAKKAKIEDHQNRIAKEILQNENKDALKKLFADVSGQIEAAFQSGDKNKLNDLEKKYQLNFEKDVEATLMTETVGTISVSIDQLKTLKANVSNKDTKPLIKKESDNATFLTASEYVKKDAPASAPAVNGKKPIQIEQSLEAKAKTEKINLAQNVATQSMKDILATLKKEIKITKRDDLL